MQNSSRIQRLTRAVLPGLVVAGALAFAGCGGDSSDDAAKAPVNDAPKSAGGVVTADATQGLVGPAARSTKDSESVQDRTGEIPANANRKTGAQRKGVAGGAACADSGMTPEEGNLAQVSAAVLCLVNGERAAENLPPLTPNSQLDQSAAGMARRMVAEKFFSHDTPDGKSVVDRVQPTGYIPASGDWVVGENLAWGSGALSTPQAIVNGWMNSPGHKANILAPDYKDIGVAAAMGSPSASHSGGTTFVHNFGARSGADQDAQLPSGSSSGSGEPAVAGAKASQASRARAARRARAGRRARAARRAKARARARARARRARR